MAQSIDMAARDGLSTGLPLNRRARLTIIFLASILLSGLALLAVLFAYSTPRTRYVDIGALADFPPSAAPYRVHAKQQYVYVVNTGQQLIVFDALTPYDPYQVALKWVLANRRFEDPMSGSKFLITGEWIDGPAGRDMDRYEYRVTRDGRVHIDLWKVVRGMKLSDREN